MIGKDERIIEKKEGQKKRNNKRKNKVLINKKKNIFTHLQYEKLK